MKTIIAVLCVLVLVAIGLLLQVGVGSPDFKGLNSWPLSGNANVNTKNMEIKMAEAIQGLSAMQKSGLKSAINNSSLNNLSNINSSSFNTSTLNLSASNTTAINASASNDSSDAKEGFGAATFSGSSTASPQGVGSSSKANFNGFWGMEANQKGLGKSGINSRMFLSGGFEVDKTVQFQDKGY
jgi:hypothetical protein